MSECGGTRISVTETCSAPRALGQFAELAGDVGARVGVVDVVGADDLEAVMRARYRYWSVRTSAPSWGQRTW